MIYEVEEEVRREHLIHIFKHKFVSDLRCEPPSVFVSSAFSAELIVVLSIPLVSLSSLSVPSSQHVNFGEPLRERTSSP